MGDGGFFFSPAVNVSGTVIKLASGSQVGLSGLQVIVQSGVNIMGTLTASVSGQPVSISGQPVSVSGQPQALVSGTQVGLSGLQVIVQSGVNIIPYIPTQNITGPYVMVTANSGGAILASGTIIAVMIKALSTNSGVIMVGGSSYMPYYVSNINAQGFPLNPGDTMGKSINNLNAVKLCAAVSGDLVAYDAVV